MERQTLAVDGRGLYVEPQILSPSPTGEVLIAGTPNYLWDRTGSQSKPESQKNAVMGVIIGKQGQARLVPFPVHPRFLSGVRAFARDDGTWAVVLAETVPEAPTRTAERMADHLWFGIFDGVSWTTLERIPLPRQGHVETLNASALVQQGDTTAWAATMVTPQRGMQAVFFERRDGRWTSEVVSNSSAPYAQLAYSGRLGFVLAVVQPDPELLADQNSLFLFGRSPGWRALRKVAAGADEPVFGPSLSFDGSGGVLSWTALVRDTQGMRYEARALVGELDGRNKPAVTLSPSVAEAFIYVPTPDGMRLWVTDHDLPDGQGSELRFIRHSAQGPTVFGRLASPFAGGFNAVAPNPSEVLIAGALLDRTGEGPTLVSLLLRARIDCGGDRGAVE